MLSNIIFYPVFAIQIFLVSIYFPSKTTRRINYVLENYPPQTYPKLYPLSIEVTKQKHRSFRLANQLLLAIGLIVIFATGIEYGLDNEIPQMLPWIYFMAQMIPLIWAEISGFQQFKLMRKLNTKASRKAELIPRKLLNFVSLPTVITTALAFIVFVVGVLYINNFEFHIGNNAFEMIVILLAGNLFFGCIIVWHLYGKKLDPNQSNHDRLKVIRATTTSLFYLSTGMSLYAITTGVFSKLDVVANPEAAIMSLYCQAIVLISLGVPMRMLRVEDLDFEVYKTEGELS